MKNTFRKSLLAGVAAVGLGLAAAPGAFAQDMPGEGVTVDMARATWDTGWFTTEIYAQLLEELGYEVADPITTLDAHLTETQERVRASVTRILGAAP